ncbi:MAG: SpoIID/LytB domain-containing protein [Bacteroidetes bacterium]|nr:MAG: SpoIID/LytB domain-containing protein [Bacteroidota bacterium]
MVKAKNDGVVNSVMRSVPVRFHQPIERAALLLCAMFLATSLAAQEIAIGLFPQKRVNSVLFAPANGSYVLTNENADTIYRFRSDDAMSVSTSGNELRVKSPYGLDTLVRKAVLLPSGTSPSFRLRLNDEKQDHELMDKLTIVADNGTLRCVDQVGMERYVGRVVQAEVGYGAAEEYYKIQSIICRTYAARNLERHTADGYDLCDSEHCQVFSGLKKTSEEVVKATSATSGLVMVDPQDNLILSAFHANCGGQTANSEDVWKESRSYLTSVTDTFCLRSRSASWEKSVPLQEMLTQLGFSSDTSGTDGWKFDQPNRKKYFAFRNDSTETAQMRRLLQLRSTYFDILVSDGLAHFSGRGYGHGVGLCQQGAMKMAESGYTYSQILGYYYKGVSLVPITDLKP